MKNRPSSSEELSNFPKGAEEGYLLGKQDKGFILCYLKGRIRALV